MYNMATMYNIWLFKMSNLWVMGHIQKKLHMIFIMMINFSLTIFKDSNT